AEHTARATSDRSARCIRGAAGSNPSTTAPASQDCAVTTTPRSPRRERTWGRSRSRARSRGSLVHLVAVGGRGVGQAGHMRHPVPPQDRKSTRLNSSHVKISYAVFCLKKKKKKVV